MIVAVIYATFAVAKRKPEKNSDLDGIRTLVLCDTGALLYQLSKQANWGPVGDDHPSFNNWFEVFYACIETIYGCL